MKRRPDPRFLTVLALSLAIGVGACRAPAADPGEATVRSVFRVEGMTCGGCETGVELKVGRLDGVASVAASHEEGRATVTYDPLKVTDEEIVTAIGELGYAAELAAPPRRDAAEGPG